MQMTKPTIVNVRLTAGDQDIQLGAGLWDLTLYVRCTTLTITGTTLGRTGQPIDVLGTQIVDAGAAGVIADGATNITGNKMVRFLFANSSAVGTGHLNAMNSNVTLVDKLRLTVAVPVGVTEITLVATRVF